MASLKKKLVLLVDDDVRYLEGMKLYLERHYEVKFASSEESAIQLATKLDRSPEMAFVDYHLGKSLGPQILQRMIANTPHHIPAAYLSNDSSKHAEAIRQGKAITFLSKSDPAILDIMCAYIDVAGPEQIERDQLGTRDELTSIFNRRGLMEAGTRMIASSSRNGEAVGAISLDMDNLKPINDKYGHSQGDAAIKFIVAAIKRIAYVMRTTDVVARVGGDEFIILLPGRDLPEVERIATHLEKTIARTPYVFENVGSIPLAITAGTDILVPEEVQHGHDPAAALRKLIKGCNDNMEAAKRLKKQKKPAAQVA